MLPRSLVCVVVLGLTIFAGSPRAAQGPAAAGQTSTAKPATESAAGTAVPPGYVIGAQDVLSIVFWRDKEMSADVTVRPDGKISLPLLNEIQAAGETPDGLREKIMQAAGKYIEEPNLTVVVKEIHSRNVFITGNVTKPGTYALSTDMNVLQLIAMAGGLQEYADSKKILVIRSQAGRQQYFRFNYSEVVKQKNVEQNITLRVGDTVVVP